MDVIMAKNRFAEIYTKYVNREGSDKLFAYLENSDFFTAPASGRFHMAQEGGLCTHSVNVYERLLSLVKADLGDGYAEVYSDETLAIVGLLHDVCKVNCYVVDYRNVKEKDGWVKKPFYKVEERFPYGHGEKSVFIVSQYMRLTAEEAISINWHMGGFDQRVKGGSYSVSEAYDKYKLAVYLHIADVMATYLDEERGEKFQ